MLNRVRILGKWIEYSWIGEKGIPHSNHHNAPVIVFLHEGLGCVAMWKKFPLLLVNSLNCHGLLYSRHGYGKSEALRSPKSTSYLYQEAIEVLPEILGHFDIHTPVLVGHSDGATIALIYAANKLDKLSGLVAIAPHVFVEEITLSGIRDACQNFENGVLRDKLARYRLDVDSVFRDWSDIWLSPIFRDWNIEKDVSRIEKPVLLIQGANDQYGSLSQISSLKRHIRSTVETEVVGRCGHSPHLESCQTTVRMTADFISKSLLFS